MRRYDREEKRIKSSVMRLNEKKIADEEERTEKKTQRGEEAHELGPEDGIRKERKRREKE